ncbi:hypothetical protein GF336_00190 [Candidatus Woesearchaeota archaeon]|nr:hypothetical protein [Candidatus Woesearchaeota archaeon]
MKKRLETLIELAKINNVCPAKTLNAYLSAYHQHKKEYGSFKNLNKKEYFQAMKRRYDYQFKIGVRKIRELKLGD